MLKYICGIFVCIFVFTMLFADQSHAVLPDVKLVQIQAGGMAAPLEELVAIYNNSSTEVEVTNWCITNKAGLGFGCFRSQNRYDHFYLPAGHYATFASQSFAVLYGVAGFSHVFVVTNQSSGSIVGGGDTISLVDEAQTIIDRHSWSTSLVSGTVFLRQQVSDPFRYIDTDTAADWQVNPHITQFRNGIIREQILPDLCSNIEGEQTELPEGYEEDGMGECIPITEEPPVVVLLPIMISEVLANAVGSDTGKEFIELYNPNTIPIDISGYQITYGSGMDKVIEFQPGTIIPPLTYIAYSNVDLPYSLPNTSSEMQLIDNAGVVIGQVPAYESPKDGASWVVVDGVWQYSNNPTPGNNNVVLEEKQAVKTAEDKTVQPCAANQYRSEETNRCRLIASSSTTAPIPCKDNQYRSEETNRCRNIAAQTTPTPCKEGQERNPETNRCRNIVTMTEADYGVLGAQEISGGTNLYIVGTVIALAVLALGYATWEWRYELKKLWARLVVFVRIRK